MNATGTFSLERRREASIFERAVEASLQQLERDRLVVTSEAGCFSFGPDRTDSRFTADSLSARVNIHSARVYRNMVLGGTLGAAESFIDGAWTTDDLTTLIRLILRNQQVLMGLESGMARLGAWAARAWQKMRPNTLSGSRRNIAAHYDLGNDFFERMLDPTLMYSSAVFPSAAATLEEASRHKLDLISGKLRLKPEDHLLEIGTGWGGLALEAASRGAHVTTTTISGEQHQRAVERVRAAGLEDRVEVLRQDYRDLRGQYDKLVSIEMIEAIGPGQYETFFERCDDLLAPGGRLVLQAITIADQAYDTHRWEVDFIKRYIFPGSCVPSVTALIQAATRASDLRLQNLEDYGSHYARTLAAWRENLLPHRSWVVGRYGERFWRMWMFYLAYCEAGFLEGYLSVVQMVMTKQRWETR